MKYIFRCALLLNFTDNREGVTIGDLRESLSSIKYNCPNVENAVKQWSACIEDLVVSSPLKAETFAAIARRHFPNNISEQELQDLLGVW